MTDLMLEEKLNLDDYIHEFFSEWSENTEASLSSDMIEKLEKKTTERMKKYIYTRFLS